MEKKCEACDKRQRFFKKRSKQTSFRSPVARSLIATGLSSFPALSNTSATTLFACTMQAFLAELGIVIPVEKVVGACPSKDTLRRIT